MPTSKEVIAKGVPY